MGKKIILVLVAVLLILGSVFFLTKPKQDIIPTKEATSAKSALQDLNITHIMDKSGLRQILEKRQANKRASDDLLPLDDGTVLDKATGLHWMRCSIGQKWDGATCLGNPQKLSFSELSAVTSNFSGYKNWRIPSFIELATITHCSSGKLFKSNSPDPDFALPSCSGEYQPPAIDRAVFPNTGDFANYDFSYWTASKTQHYDKKGAWIINFSDPFSASELQPNAKHAVRLVRRVK